jgi:hypothetical protein
MKNIADMVKWPRSWWGQSMIALLGATPLAIICAYVAFRLSFAYFVSRYPHDGQDVLGSVGIFLVVGAAMEVVIFVGFLTFERQWALRQHLSHFTVGRNSKNRS